jgi:hypothetical protein
MLSVVLLPITAALALTPCRVIRAKDAYLGVIAFWVTKEWKMASKLLAVKPFKGSHDAVSTADLVKGVLTEWGIKTEDVSYIVTDNASTMIAMVRDHLQPWLRIPCSAHWLQLTVKDCLGLSDNKDLVVAEVDDLIKKVRAGAAHFSRSTQSLGTLQGLQDAAASSSGGALRPENDQETRWNSTYDMLKKWDRLHSSLDSFWSLSQSEQEWELSRREWKLLEQLLATLRPLADSTDDLQADKVWTARA